MKIKNICWITLSSIVLLLTTSVQAGKPLWTFISDPSAPPTVSLSNTDTAIIKYRVTNQSRRTHTLYMKPVIGITQVISGTTCPNPFTLVYKKSCTLALLVKGALLPGNVSGGPVVCQAGNSMQCYQPSPGNSLNITKLSQNIAGIKVSPTSLLLTAGSGMSGSLKITNSSTNVTALNVKATLPQNWADVTQDASQCTSIAPGHSCQLIFTPGNSTHSLQTIQIKGNNTLQVTAAISVNASTAAPLTVTPSSLALTATSGVPGNLTIKNTSANVTAENVKASLPPSWSDVTQDASQCTSIAPGRSCQLIFTPGNTTHSAQNVPIQGSNTTQITATLSVDAPSTTTINVSPTSLTLTASSGISKNVTITNASLLVTALNVQATLPVSWADVTQDASQCTSIYPGSSCQLIFTPGNSAHAAQAIPIQGSNTNQVTATIAVDAPLTTTLSTTASSMALAKSGNARQITITNYGSETAFNITYSIAPSLPTGTTISPANCGTMLPTGTCTLTITPGATASSATMTMTLKGTNTNTLNIALDVLEFGSIYQQGYVFSLNDTTAIDTSVGGTEVALTNNAPLFTIPWDSSDVCQAGSCVLTGATSITEGDANTVAISVTLSPQAGVTSTNYAAGLCSDYTIDSSGNSPCVTGTCYQNWYLPAICQMGPASNGSGCTAGTPNIVENLPSLIGCAQTGCLNGFFWSSTQFNTSSGWMQNFSNSSSQLGLTKSTAEAVRCVRDF
ncbi:hypothetical protein OQJ15_02235 [Fluoribacter dumoffii]|uniref:hypothetical protein n=1 Tax=Fluoribacter dumoffii TaxID=463 RepID=UPI002243BE41|nr:hypothetical protein [Fluoribacter dumoffii]MCW8385117.1 hypothetical protein [Fluoribacter dumoffii]MCW8496585.1 hypothetical protein [Fluoribacter dumoffii]